MWVLEWYDTTGKRMMKFATCGQAKQYAKNMGLMITNLYYKEVTNDASQAS